MNTNQSDDSGEFIVVKVIDEFEDLVCHKDDIEVGDSSIVECTAKDRVNVVCQCNSCKLTI